MNYPDTDKLAVDVYMAFRRRHGALSLVSGHRGQNDSTKLSRQLNPTDERRDNPFIEVLEILRATAQYAPEIENEIWTILEARRAEWTAGNPAPPESLSRLIHSVGDELNDVVEAVIDRATMPAIYKEVVELEEVIVRLKAKCAASLAEVG